MTRILLAIGVAAVLGGLLIGVAVAQTARQACRADYQTLCKGVRPGGGRIAECFKAHASELSPGCVTALKAAQAQHQSGG